MFIFVTCDVSPFAGFAWFLARAVLKKTNSNNEVRLRIQGHNISGGYGWFLPNSELDLTMSAEWKRKMHKRCMPIMHVQFPL